MAILDLFEGRLTLSEILDMPYSNLKRLYEAKERQLEKQKKQQAEATRQNELKIKTHT